MKHFIKFATLSGGGWLLDCAFLVMLAGLGVSLGVSNFVSSITASVAVFILSRRFIFDSNDDQALRGALFYVVYQLFNILVVSLLIGPVATSTRESLEAFGIFPNAGWTSFLGKVLMTPPQLLANFILSRFLAQYWRRSSTHV